MSCTFFYEILTAASLPVYCSSRIVEVASCYEIALLHFASPPTSAVRSTEHEYLSKSKSSLEKIYLSKSKK